MKRRKSKRNPLDSKFRNAEIDSQKDVTKRALLLRARLQAGEISERHIRIAAGTMKDEASRQVIPHKLWIFAAMDDVLDDVPFKILFEIAIRAVLFLQPKNQILRDIINRRWRRGLQSSFFLRDKIRDTDEELSEVVEAMDFFKHELGVNSGRALSKTLPIHITTFSTDVILSRFYRLLHEIDNYLLHLPDTSDSDELISKTQEYLRRLKLAALLGDPLPPVKEKKTRRML